MLVVNSYPIDFKNELILSINWSYLWYQPRLADFFPLDSTVFNSVEPVLVSLELTVPSRACFLVICWPIWLGQWLLRLARHSCITSRDFVDRVHLPVVRVSRNNFCVKSWNQPNLTSRIDWARLYQVESKRGRIGRLSRGSFSDEIIRTILENRLVLLESYLRTDASPNKFYLVRMSFSRNLGVFMGCFNFSRIAAFFNLRFFYGLCLDVNVYNWDNYGE